MPHTEEKTTQKIEIIDEENSIIMDDDFSVTSFEFFPENKKFTVEMSVKDDCFYNYQTLEYKLSINPLELYIRLIECSSEPPKEYSVKDGVVLESEINKKQHALPSRIKDLKKQVEWNKVDLLAQYAVNLYILSKHPEIISQEEYRKFLRQTVERIKNGIAKVEEALKNDNPNLQIHKYDSGKGIWYPDSESGKKERDEYCNLSNEEERKKSEYGKKIEYVEKINDSLFKEDSQKYVGITKYEFETSEELIDYIEKLLNQKSKPTQKTEAVPAEKQVGKNKNYTILVYLITVLFIFLKLTDNLDWNWFGVLAPVLVWEGFGFLIGFLRGLNK